MRATWAGRLLPPPTHCRTARTFPLPYSPRTFLNTSWSHTSGRLSTSTHMSNSHAYTQRVTPGWLRKYVSPMLSCGGAVVEKSEGYPSLECPSLKIAGSRQ